MQLSMQSVDKLLYSLLDFPTSDFLKVGYITKLTPGKYLIDIMAECRP